MPRIPALLSALLAAAALSAPLPAQSEDERKFITEFTTAFGIKDDKETDRLVKRFPEEALHYFQNLRLDIWRGKEELREKTDFLKASWARVHDSAATLDEVERWIDSQTPSSFEDYQRAQSNNYKAQRFFAETTAKDNTARRPFEESRDALMQVARQFEMTGHKVDAAGAWAYVAACLSKIPERTLQDRRDEVFALEQFVDYREAWHWKTDDTFLRNANYLKAQKVALAEAETKEGERQAAGYGEGARGIDAYVMPGVPEAVVPLEFEALADWEGAQDYSIQGGPLPQLWWFETFGKDVENVKLRWFRSQDLFLTRQSATRFSASTNPDDAGRSQPVETNGKPSRFFLDAERKVPYALFVWIGSDQERIGEAQVNIAPSVENTRISYSSAASWHCEVGGQKLIVYDDNTSGQPMDPDPWAGKFPLHTLGGAQSEAPLLDSMQVGKGGKRMPFSEFVKIGDGWHHVRRADGLALGTRPLNPQFLETGHIELEWKGPKTSAPQWLVVQGSGDFSTAFFDVAGGKPVEVPAGSYRVILGRIVQGKGGRTQMATIYGGGEPFAVEPGKTFALTMGAPFTIEFERGGSGDEVQIDGTKVHLREASGCRISDMQFCSVVPDVMAARDESGKGAKRIGRFVKFADAELLNKAAEKYPNLGLRAACFPLPQSSRDGGMVLAEKLPDPDMKVGLTVKKHALFGKLDSDWK